MIKAILLGPSGVGKSTLGQAVAQQCQLHFADLDLLLAETWPDIPLAEALVSYGLQAFYTRSLNLLAGLARAQPTYIVAMGAGSQWAAQGDLQCLAYPSICLWAQALALWQRNRRLRQDPRSLEAFTQIEYHPLRETLYSQCQQHIDCSHISQQEAQDILLGLLNAGSN